MIYRNFFLCLALAIPLFGRADVVVLKDGKPACAITVDNRNAVGEGPATLADAAQWLEDSLGGGFPKNSAQSIVIARADAFPDIAARVHLVPDAGYDAYAIVTETERVLLLGNSEAAARHAVADLLRRWGFRQFAPSPRWRIKPKLDLLTIDFTTVEKPALIDRRIWYAYGMGDDTKPLMDDYQRWVHANRLSLRSPINNGHSYGNIIQRNAEAFANDPELSALLPDGTRDTVRSPNARKFCFSNPALIDLVAEDRKKLLGELRKANPASFMVSVDPSDGEGTCHCARCAALGTTSDRVFHLANEVARRLRATDPTAWVGLYAYSSHRLPPTIPIESNVYVQVAMGFNRTEFSLPELVDRWSKKVGAIGLREYYGVEAWDWGLPGRARGARVGYHEKWIPFFAERKLNAINAETNANWGTQTLGLYVAAQLMWNPKANAKALADEFFTLAYGDAAAGPMRAFHEKMEAAPPLRAATLLPLFEDLESAVKATRDAGILARLADLQAYLIYVAKYREFDLVQSRQPSRNDTYYSALESLMNYTWRIRMRDTAHYYALARRLCNGLPIEDKRPEFYLARKEANPVWMHGEAPSDAEIATWFSETAAKLRADRDPTVNFSRYLDSVVVPGEDAGPAQIHQDEREAVARFRGGLLGYLVPSGPLTAKLGVSPVSKPVTITVHFREETIFEREIKGGGGMQELSIELPRAFEYRVEISGEFELRVPRETPLVFEASSMQPAWIDYSGPHYFYVPKGTTELIVDGDPRLSLMVPGVGKRDLVPADRQAGQDYLTVSVPPGADGQVWHTHSLTRGRVSLLNVPPLLSFHRQTVLVPREVSETDGLTTGAAK